MTDIKTYSTTLVGSSRVRWKHGRGEWVLSGKRAVPSTVLALAAASA